MFNRITFLHIFMLFIISTANGQEQDKEKTISPYVNGNYTSRYFSLQNENSDTEKIQGALTLNLGVNLGEKFSAHSTLVQTPALGKRFYTIYDFNKPDNNPKLFNKDGESFLPSAVFIQKLYLQFDNDKTKIQVGTIPRAELSEKFKNDHNTKSSSLEDGFMGSNAWVDGVRISQDISEKDRPAVLLTLTIGSLDQLSTPYSDRNVDFDPNYVEAQINIGDCKGGILEGSVGVVDDEIFIRTGLEKLINVTNTISTKLYSESLYNVTENEIALILGYQTDLLKAFKPELKDKLKLAMEVAYIGENIGTRGIMANDAFLPGNRFRIQLSGKINKNGDISWFTQKDFGTTNIVSAGAKVSFRNKK